MAISGSGKVKDVIESSRTTTIILIQNISNPDTLFLCELEPGTQLPENAIGQTVRYETEEAPAAESVNPFFTRRKNKIGPASLPKIRLNKLEFEKEDGKDGVISPA